MTEETESLQKVKYDYIYKILQKNDFHRQRTADDLQISIRTLRNIVNRMDHKEYPMPITHANQKSRVPPEKNYLHRDYDVKGMATNEERLRYYNFTGMKRKDVDND